MKVEVPGLGVVDFPDGMSREDMAVAIRKTLAARAPAQSGAEALAAETGPMDAALVGAGRATDKIVQGVRQGYNWLTGDQKTLDSMAQAEAEKDALYAPLKTARPFATGIGEAAPMMAVPFGQGLGIVRGALAGAVPGLVSYGDAEERAKAGGIGAAGGAVGSAFGQIAARILKPAGAGAPMVPQEAQEAAKRLGYQMSAGQKSQNPAMLSLENYLSRSPGSSGAMQAKALANQAAIDKAAAQAMGQGDTLGEGAFGAAKNAIGAEYRRLEGMSAPQVGDELLAALTSIDTKNAAKGAFRNPAVDALVKKGLDLAEQGHLTGQAYKEVRSELASQAFTAGKSGDAPLKEALKAVVGTLDDAAKTSLPQVEQGAWDTARKQWTAYKLLSKSNVSEGGSVSPARLAAAMRAQGDGLRTGAAQGPLSDVARLGEALKSVPNPTSGQMTQMAVYGNPITAPLAIVGNKVTASVYNNPQVQKWLSQGLVDIGPTGEFILGRAMGPVGVTATQQYTGAR